MGPIIVDTSVWVDGFQGVQNAKTKLITDCLAANQQVEITPVLLQEVLQGVRDDSRFDRIKDDLLACTMLRLDPVEAAIGAATLYRMLCKKGVTIRKPNDCLIAHYAIFYDIPVLHSDVDFDQMARHSPLRILVI